MKKILCIFLILFSAQTHATEIRSQHCCNYTRGQEASKIEIVFSVPTSELILTNEGIGVHYNGEILDVYSLERVGENWNVRVSLKCRNGHLSICWYCRGCAASHCPYRCPGDCRPN